MDPVNLLPLSLFCFVIVPQVTSDTSGFYMDTSSQSVLIETLDKSQKGFIKDEMLDILGIHVVPRHHMHHQKSATQYMTELYNEYNLQESTNDESNEHADLVISFVNNDIIPQGPYQRTLHFDFSDVPQVESVENAQLRIYKHAEDLSIPLNSTLTIAIFRLVQRHRNGEIMLQLEGSNSSVPVSYEGWVVFNVTAAASSWTNFQISNLGLYVEVTNDLGEIFDPSTVGLITSQPYKDDLQPFLVTYFKTAQRLHERTRREVVHRRIPRSSGAQSINNNFIHKDFKWNRPEPCQRRSLVVNFEDLNWKEWIIAPTSYSAYYCTGECNFPLSSHMNASNHAIVQTLVHLFQDDVPKPGCAPTRLSHVSVLFFDDYKNVRLWEFKNMVVKACGCL